MRLRVSKLLDKGKAMFLAYDQGLEHGPVDFNDKNADPQYIFDIALEGGYNGIIVHHGIAEKYHLGAYKEIPLIVKLNGKTGLAKTEPISKQLCSVERAVKLGADAVGYTVYVGSKHEEDMLVELGKIVEEAHNYGIPVIAWMYPRGEFCTGMMDDKMIEYAARIGLESGADFLKMMYNGNIEHFKWMVKCAGRAKVLVAGGSKLSEEELFQRTKEVIDAGAVGLAIGRNIWQSDKPFSITKALKSIVFHNKSVREAMNILK